jgi:plastocyanin
LVSRIQHLEEILLMTKTRLTTASLFVLLAALASACGGGNDNPGTGPSGGGGSGGGGGGTGTVAATITITASGVSPQNVTVAPGSRVTFVNNDSRPHDMASNPHPAHTDCPEITVGFLQAGQSGTTQNLNRVATCGFHDHNQDTNTSLQGTIRIQ